MNRGRAPRPVRRTGTEIMSDRRTRRRRTRATEEEAAIHEYLDTHELEDILADLRRRESS